VDVRASGPMLNPVEQSLGGRATFIRESGFRRQTLLGQGKLVGTAANAPGKSGAHGLQHTDRGRLITAAELGAVIRDCAARYCPLAAHRNRPEE
jgi:hypothetical protein